MATAHERLTPAQEQLGREYAASYAAQQRRAADPEFMLFLRKRLEELTRAPSGKRTEIEEFIAQTEHLRP